MVVPPKKEGDEERAALELSQLLVKMQTQETTEKEEMIEGFIQHLQPLLRVATDNLINVMKSRFSEEHERNIKEMKHLHDNEVLYTKNETHCLDALLT